MEKETDAGYQPILDYLREKRGFDFCGYHPPMLKRRLNRRLTATACLDFSQYFSFLQENAAELDHLLDVLTINVSSFFRNTLTFELIADIILPAIVREKARGQEHSLRIWSAGCAKGEEPYSLAILIRELLAKEGLEMNLHIFATDIDSGALEDAAKTLYSIESVEHMKYRLLQKYFIAEGDSFRLIPEIKNLVSFSLYDILDKERGVPPESVFGHFDLVLCRNLLIYFSLDYQQAIFEKLYHSLAKNAYLVLGEAETPAMKYRHHFSRVFDFSTIYRKR